MSCITGLAGDCSSFIRISTNRARLRSICRRWTVVTTVTQYTVRAIAVCPNLRKQFRVTINRLTKELPKSGNHFERTFMIYYNILGTAGQNSSTLSKKNKNKTVGGGHNTSPNPVSQKSHSR